MERQGKSSLSFDLSAGLFYCNKSNEERQFFAGLSVLQLANINFGDTIRGGERLPNTRKPQMNFLVGLYIDPLPDYDKWLLFEPSILVKYTPRIKGGTLLNNIPLTVDFNFRSYFSLDKTIDANIDNFWLGAGYSSSANLNFELGITKAFSNTSNNTEGRFVRLGILAGIPLGNQYVHFGPTIEALLAVSLE